MDSSRNLLATSQSVAIRTSLGSQKDLQEPPTASSPSKGCWLDANLAVTTRNGECNENTSKITVAEPDQNKSSSSKEKADLKNIVKPIREKTASSGTRQINNFAMVQPTRSSLPKVPSVTSLPEIASVSKLCKREAPVSSVSRHKPVIRHSLSADNITAGSPCRLPKLPLSQLPDTVSHVASSSHEITSNSETLSTRLSSQSLNGLRNSFDSLSSATGSSSFLPRISVQEARKRSFLVGNISSRGSLLGAEELERYFPDRKVRIFVGTWNMNGQTPPQSLNDFLLPMEADFVADIYAIGVQEGIADRKEWEISMQTTLGPSHVLFHSVALGVLYLCVFIRRDLVWFCSTPEDAVYNSRPGSMVKTKGTIAVCFTLFGTSMMFVNSHFTAHERKLKERISDYEKACSMIDLPRSIPLKPLYQSRDVTARFDCVFWCGDLNFRLVQERESVLSALKVTSHEIMSMFNGLLAHDQLKKNMNDGCVFRGFQEGHVNFMPSYKFDVGTQNYDTVKLRVPSYTDRVLFHCKRKNLVECLRYDMISHVTTSDHRPVYAMFEAKLRPGRDNIPLAAGLFNREVYIEGNRRRAVALENKSDQKGSLVCLVM